MLIYSTSSINYSQGQQSELATCLIRVTARTCQSSKCRWVRALVPPALQMMEAEVPQAICQKLPLDRGRRELQILKMKIMWQRKRPHQGELSQLKAQSQGWKSKGQQVGSPCQRPELQLKSLHPKSCWKYALEAIIKALLLYFLVHDNCLYSCYNCVIRKS